MTVQNVVMYINREAPPKFRTALSKKKKIKKAGDNVLLQGCGK